MNKQAEPTKQINVRVRDVDLARLDELSNRLEVSKSDVVRMALRALAETQL